MHIGYLALAVRNLLREYLNNENFPDNPFKESEIEVTPQGKPFAFNGQQFLGVYGSSWSPATQDSNIGLDAYMGINVVLTVRSPVFSQKKTGVEMYANLQCGMAAICWHIAKSVAMTSGSTTGVPLYAHLAALEGYVPYSIFEYLRWSGTDPEPIPAYQEWFTATNEHLNDPLGQSIMGYTMSVRFAEARGGYRMS